MKRKQCDENTDCKADEWGGNCDPKVKAERKDCVCLYECIVIIRSISREEGEGESEWTSWRWIIHQE
jgi:hypothetical protein